MRVVDLIDRRVGRVVVDVEIDHRRAVEEPQALEGASTLIHVVGVEQQAGFRVAGLHGHEGRFAGPAERLRPAPDLQLGDDADRLADFENLAIAARDVQQVDPRRAVDSSRRCGDVAGAQFGQHPHGLFHLLDAPGASGLVCNRPLGEVDRAGDPQSRVVDPLAQVLQRAAPVDVFLQIASPGLDRPVAGLGRHVDLFGRREIMPEDRAGVQPEDEPLRGLGRCWRHRRRSPSEDRRPGQCPRGGDEIASRKSVGHRLA